MRQVCSSSRCAILGLSFSCARAGAAADRAPAANLGHHRLIIHGNEAFAAAELLAQPTAGNSVLSSELLKSVNPLWLERQSDLRKLADRKFTEVYDMPQLALHGAFCIEALVNNIVLRYPGVPLNLLSKLQV